MYWSFSLWKLLQAIGGCLCAAAFFVFCSITLKIALLISHLLNTCKHHSSLFNMCFHEDCSGRFFSIFDSNHSFFLYVHSHSITTHACLLPSRLFSNGSTCSGLLLCTIIQRVSKSSQETAYPQIKSISADLVNISAFILFNDKYAGPVIILSNGASFKSFVNVTDNVTHMVNRYKDVYYIFTFHSMPVFSLEKYIFTHISFCN